MTDYVVDTNVWIMVDTRIANVTTLEELNCIEACRQWIENFGNSQGRLVIDSQYLILKEYRRNIQRGGRAGILLGRLESQPRNRLVEVSIEVDDSGHARVPEALDEIDLSDRKFVAVALAHNPIPSIIDATDTDWAKCHEALMKAKIEVQELCPDIIAAKLK